MKQILLTLEAGSLEEEVMLLEATHPLTESNLASSQNKEEVWMISGSLTIAP